MRLRRLLRSLAETDKCIVFSTFTAGLDVAEALLHADGIEYCRFDGGDKRGAVRTAILKRFRETPKVRVLLLSMYVGGVGLNIPEANHGYFLDTWWNPFVHSQCEDRMHRIGQKKPVHISYLLAAGSFDEAGVSMSARCGRDI